MYYTIFIYYILIILFFYIIYIYIFLSHHIFFSMTFCLSCFSKRSKLNHRKTWTQPSVILLVVDRDAGSNQAFYNGDVVSLMYFFWKYRNRYSIYFYRLRKDARNTVYETYMFFSENISIS